MFKDDGTLVAPQTDTVKPKVRKEIHIFTNWAGKNNMPTLTFDPLGVVEKAVVNELIEVLGFPMLPSNAGLRGHSDAVALAAAICTKYGWQKLSDWLDEKKDLHVKMWKEVDA